MKKAAILLALAAAATYPAAAGAASFKGIVIARQAARHALVVTSRSGLVRTVRVTSTRARVGAGVAVTARLLPDGTYRAVRVAVRGHYRRAHLRATVVGRAAGRYVVSAGHSTVAIRMRRHGFGVFGTTPTPQPGDQIDANVTLAPNGELDEQDVEETGHTDAVEVQGKVVSVTGTPPTAITVQPEEGPAVTVQVPAGFQLPALTPGQEVELKASVSGTTLTLLKLSTDGGDNGEHDGNNNDEHGQNDDSNDQHGDGGGGGDG